MHDFPRQKLIELIQQHGLDLCKEPKRLEALLRDSCKGEYKREVFVLTNALKEGIATELLSFKADIPLDAFCRKLSKQLHEHLGLDCALSEWCVETWSLAILGKNKLNTKNTNLESHKLKQSITSQTQVTSNSNATPANQPISPLPKTVNTPKKQSNSQNKTPKTNKSSLSPTHKPVSKQSNLSHTVACTLCGHDNAVGKSDTYTVCKKCKKFFYIPVAKKSSPQTQTSSTENVCLVFCKHCRSKNNIALSSHYAVCKNCNKPLDAFFSK